MSFPESAAAAVMVALLFLLCGGATAEAEVFSSREFMAKMAGYGEEKVSTVLVTGTLLCDARLHVGEDHHELGLMLPISGAVVGLTCHKKRNTKKSWASSTTDEYGDFAIDVPSHLHAVPHLHRACSVKALRLPKTSPCRPSFGRSKKHGAAGARQHHIIRLSSVADGGVRQYTTGTIRLTAAAGKPGSKAVRV